MPETYRFTISLCPRCAADVPAQYDERADGMFLTIECPACGRSEEMVERDIHFFKSAYEHDYQKPVSHLVLPVTYRCNLACKYCYTLSNSRLAMPPDRTIAQIAKFTDNTDSNITVIGGEPTIRPDLPEILAMLKGQSPLRKISVATNGQKISDPAYLKTLRDHGLDFVFLSLNDPRYEDSQQTYAQKIAALTNCRRMRIPVWLQRTVSAVDQVDSLSGLLEEFSRIVFFITLRAVKPFGLLYPRDQVFVSDMQRRLDLVDRTTFGTNPFNRLAELRGKTIKLCSWVNDVSRVDPVDSAYLISNDTVTTFHRGMKYDELLLQGKRHGFPHAVSKVRSFPVAGLAGNPVQN